VGGGGGGGGGAPRAPGSRCAGEQLAIIRAHFADQGRDQMMKEGLHLPQLVAVANGAPDDTPQDVASSLVGGYYSVDDQEGAGANMVGDDPQAR